MTAPASQPVPALEEAADKLEMEAFRRAVEGIGENTYFRGDVVGSVTRYSDWLLMFLLKAQRPSKFGSGAVAQAAAGQEADECDLAELCPRMERAASRDEPGAD